MAKRHIITSKKQYLGQYFTTEAEKILDGWEHYVDGKHVIDPFVGNKDLLSWATRAGARSTLGYDIDPQYDDVISNDSLINPPDYKDCFLISNPPYLAANKCRTGDKRPYQIWKQSDYYKCHIASLRLRNCSEGILIIPSNFFSESNATIRNLFFKDYKILEMRYWREKVFKDTNHGITAFVFKSDSQDSTRQVPFELFPEGTKDIMILEEKYKWLWGQEFFDYLEDNWLGLHKYISGESNTNIIVGCLDNGKYPTGFHYNDGEPRKTPKSVITTFQLNSNYPLATDVQKKIVRLANERLEYFREKYHSMFLSNYLGATQKILSQKYAIGLLNGAATEIIGRPVPDSWQIFFNENG